MSNEINAETTELGNHYYTYIYDSVKVFQYTGKSSAEGLAAGSWVVVKTPGGKEKGVIKKRLSQTDPAKIAQITEKLNKNESVNPGKDNKFDPNAFYILGPMSEEDIERVNKIDSKEKEAFKFVQGLIKQYSLKMNLIDVHITYDEGKHIYNYTSTSRIDFRQLLKDITGKYRARIELKQIGIRDKAKLVGGYGVCGKELCCSQCKKIPNSITVKMAKEQELNLNTEKLSGVCGRLMCCLTYEYENYREHLESLASEKAKLSGTNTTTSTGTDSLRKIKKLSEAENEEIETLSSVSI